MGCLIEHCPRSMTAHMQLSGTSCSMQCLGQTACEGALLHLHCCVVVWSLLHLHCHVVGCAVECCCRLCFAARALLRMLHYTQLLLWKAAAGQQTWEYYSVQGAIWHCVMPRHSDTVTQKSPLSAALHKCMEQEIFRHLGP